MPDPRKKKPAKKYGIWEGGPTPAGRETADSLKKHGVGSALRTVGRAYKDEFVQSLKGKPQQATGDPDPGAQKRKLRLKQITDSVDKKIAPPMKKASAKIGKKARPWLLIPRRKQV